jgi:hypothetical protein
MISFTPEGIANGNEAIWRNIRYAIAPLPLTNGLRTYAKLFSYITLG